MPLYPNMGTEDYLEIFLRRRWFIAFSIIIILFGASVYSVLVPEQYKSSTTILVIPQRVPENYVRSTVSGTIQNRLNTIHQQVLSRTRLEYVMNEMGLFLEERKKKPLESVLNKMRKRIEIDVKQQDSFTLSFTHENPNLAMLTTSRLASFFIDENVRRREQMAEGAAEFLDSQLKQTKAKLEVQEERVRRFKTSFMGELPQQLQANLQILSRLQDQEKENSGAIRSAQDRKVALEDQIRLLENQVRTLESQALAARPGEEPEPVQPIQEEPVIPEDPAAPLVADLNMKRAQLANLSNRYTDNYPEIRRLKSDIVRLETQVREARKEAPAPVSAANKSAKPPKQEPRALTGVAAREREEIRKLRVQLANIEAELKSLKNEKSQIDQRVADMESRVEATPKREQEMIAITRDYENLKLSYDDLQRKKLEADVAQNLEKKQKGEQFQVLDPAHLPLSPIIPNRQKIFGVSVIVALLVGFGGAIGFEYINTEVRSVKEFRHFSSLSILATIPRIQEASFSRSLSMRKDAVLGGIATFATVLTVYLIAYGEKVRSVLQGVR
jgi:polysaccharide chain length determinant protein (PEP-CTERM system associated)